jgi:hypothetical protein
MTYFVSWIRDGKIVRFAHPHQQMDSALAFACEAFKVECSDVWVTVTCGNGMAAGAAAICHLGNLGVSL